MAQVVDPKYFACGGKKAKDYGSEGSSASSDMSLQQSDLDDADWDSGTVGGDTEGEISEGYFRGADSKDEMFLEQV